MIAKSKKIFILVLGIFVFLFLQSFQVPSQQTYFCAEKTTNGAWCQNVPENEVNKNYNWAPTSCETTAFCKAGTCVNGLEGTCLPNTPQKVCTKKNNGVWIEGKPDEISQCQLGCCFVGDGASFVTQTRCSRLSAIYGLETNFHSEIKDQEQCLLSAFPKAKGACVIDDGFSRKCKFSTREECSSLNIESNSETKTEFHEGFLCSAASLGTICGPTVTPKIQTMLVEGKDEVYFKDTCGNPGNIYDASKVNDQEYWTKIINSNESCKLNYDSNGNPTNSATCGNCNYFEGSVGKAYQRGNSQTPVQPRYGDFVCAALNCKWQGQMYKHGESWCANTATNTKYENLPGSESFRIVCYAGEISIENPDPWRATMCVQDEVNEFKVGSFRTNKWQDCIPQDNQKDCENTEKRDCKWTTSSLYHDLYGLAPPEVYRSLNGSLVSQGGGGICVPKYPPGFGFYDNGTYEQAQQLCAQFNTECVVKYEKSKVFGAWECVENCECQINNGHGREFENLCRSLGDCGTSTNYIGVQGWNEKSYVDPGAPD